VDAIWRAAGDTATDWNFYTKRGLLAGVFSSTVLCWLDDTSEDHAETWAFLDRRIADVMRVPKATARVREACGRFARPFQRRTYGRI
jgi:ubiquinone biosynthesis protein COQ9